MANYLDYSNKIKSGNFIITNQAISKKVAGIGLLKKVGDYHVFLTPRSEYQEKDGLLIYTEGYVQPRNQYFKGYNSFSQKELIFNLIKKYNNKFINYIKGNFTIIIINNNVIDIFTDHFGFRSCFLYQSTSLTAIFYSINWLKCLDINLEPDGVSLAIHSILHLNPYNRTTYKYINRTPPGTHIRIINNELKLEQYWNVDSLLELSMTSPTTFTYYDFAYLLRKDFHNFLICQKPNQHAITLTGGKDSRTGLACLKSLGINPYGFTYGDLRSRDAIYARKLAKKASIHHFTFNPLDTDNYYDVIADEIISYGNPDINLCRAHRLYAFKKMAEELTGPSAYYAGYMAGEFLMGIYYDNLVFTRTLTNFWDTSIKPEIQPVLEYSFLRTSNLDLDEVNSRLYELQTFNSSLSISERQFYGIFEIGLLHHCQDIFLADKYFDYVYPFFIDVDFLKQLFKSSFSFFFVDNKTINPLCRYKLFKFNLNIQHILYPELDKVPFGKRGSYTTSEFLKGKYYWAFVKTLRYILQRKRFPFTYVYSKTFRNFVLKHLIDLKNEKDHILNEYYNISKAITTLHSINENTNELPMHRFSNIVMLYLQMKNFINNLNV